MIKVRKGEPLSADTYNQNLARVEQLGRASVQLPVQITTDGTGQSVRYLDSTLWATLTSIGDNGGWNWLEVLPIGNGTWQYGDRSGTNAINPAYEAIDADLIPGIIVLLRVGATDEYVFQSCCYRPDPLDSGMMLMFGGQHLTLPQCTVYNEPLSLPCCDRTDPPDCILDCTTTSTGTCSDWDGLRFSMGWDGVQGWIGAPFGLFGVQPELICSGPTGAPCTNQMVLGFCCDGGNPFIPCCYSDCIDPATFCASGGAITVSITCDVSTECCTDTITFTITRYTAPDYSADGSGTYNQFGTETLVS